MKKYFGLVLLMLATMVFAAPFERKPVFRHLRSFYVDLDNDGKLDTIAISTSLAEKGLFNKISVKLAGYQTKSFIAKQYWTNFDKRFLDSNKNLVASKLVFVKKTDKHAAILLWGNTDGAGYAVECSIINIENHQSKLVFDGVGDTKGVQNPEKLIDLQNNGRLCFIYNDIGEYDEILHGGNVGEYRPSYVYPVSDTCKLNKPLMKLYNEKYYVFAGYNASNKIRVYHPNNGDKPKLLKRERKEE